nr:uncharacterized protein LOC111856863 [Paramormyrops kingsleyae]
MPEDKCKKTWKNLRDRYIKERKKVREKKSGAGAEHKTTWKFFLIMSFLEPYVRERATSSNMSPPSESRPSSPQATSAPLPASSDGTPSDEPFSLYLTEVLPTTQTTSSPLAELAPEPLFLAPAASQKPGPSPCTPRASTAPSILGSRQRMKRKRDEFEDKLLKAIEQPTDEDELFLLSLAPRLRNLPKRDLDVLKSTSPTNSLERARYRRRWDLRILGLTEKENENTCEIGILTRVVPVSVEKLQLMVDTVHRLGKKDNAVNKMPRPIIIQFSMRTARDEVWRKSKEARVCKELNIKFKEDFSKEDHEAQIKLWPKVQEARHNGRRAFLKEGYAIINGKRINP